IMSALSKRVPQNPAGTVGNTAGNLYNNGLFCENDGYVYFANAYDSSSLYRMRPDESEMEKMAYTEVTSLNADGKYLYYYQGGSGSGTGLGFVLSTTGIYRVNKSKPSDATCLDRVNGKYVLLADNDVYYTCSSDEVSLKKVSTDGKNKETLLALDILPVSVQNSTFYYLNNEENLHLMALDLRTNTSRQVLAEDVYMPIIEGNMVYGIDIHDNYSLISLNTTDGSKTRLDTGRIDLLNVTDNYIYYQTSGSSPQLKRIRRDGSGMEVVADGAYSNITATSQYIYFTQFGTSTPVYKTPTGAPVNVTTFDRASQAAIAEFNKNKK
ncbi:MAG: DUF5050 domain-containing protein, partial [Lachnospiraceae bacterium]|nr:DUF5050 domain-containing protein [Lachnospiraceae bacterium]